MKRSLRRHDAHAGSRPTATPANPAPTIPGTPPGPCSEPQPHWPAIDDRMRLTPQSQLALAA